MSEIGEPIAGSIDEAAAAIEGLYRGESAAPAITDHDAETDEVAAQIEGNQAAPEPESQEPAVEAKPEGNEPAAIPSKDETPIHTAKEHTPQPTPAPQATPKAEDATKSASPKLSDLENLVTQYQAQVAVAFPDIRSIEDLERLAAEGQHDRIMQYSVAERKLLFMQQELQKARGTYRQQWQAEQDAEARGLLPDWDDTEKRTALVTKLVGYARENGWSQERIDWATAKDANLIRKAMLYDERVKADEVKAKADAEAIIAAKKKAAEAPPVQKPGTPKVTDKKDEKTQELSERFRKSGRIDDLAALLESRA